MQSVVRADASSSITAGQRTSATWPLLQLSHPSTLNYTFIASMCHPSRLSQATRSPSSPHPSTCPDLTLTSFAAKKSVVRSEASTSIKASQGRGFNMAPAPTLPPIPSPLNSHSSHMFSLLPIHSNLLSQLSPPPHPAHHPPLTSFAYLDFFCC